MELPKSWLMQCLSPLKPSWECFRTPVGDKIIVVAVKCL